MQCNNLLLKHVCTFKAHVVFKFLLFMLFYNLKWDSVTELSPYTVPTVQGTTVLQYTYVNI